MGGGGGGGRQTDRQTDRKLQNQLKRIKESNSAEQWISIYIQCIKQDHIQQQTTAHTPIPIHNKLRKDDNEESQKSTRVHEYTNVTKLI